MNLPQMNKSSALLVFLCLFYYVYGEYVGITQTPISSDSPNFVFVHNQILNDPTPFWGVVSRPYPTNSWYSNLAVRSYPVVVFPYLVNTMIGGIIVCYPLLKAESISYTSSWHDDMLFYIDGLSNRSIVDRTLLGVTTAWPSKDPSNPAYPTLTVPWVPGHPYITMAFTGSTFNLSTGSIVHFINGQPPVAEACSVSEKFQIKITDPSTTNSQIWNLYALNGTTIKLCYFPNARVDPTGPHPVLTGTTDLSPEQVSVLRLAIVADPSAESVLDQYVSTIVVGGDVSVPEIPRGDNTTVITFTWHAVDVNWRPYLTEDILMMGLPHHDDCINKSMLKQSGLLPNVFLTIKGPMIGYLGSKWGLNEKLTDIVWNSRYPIDATHVDDIINQLNKEAADYEPHENDTYGYGKYLSAVARMILLADELNQVKTHTTLLAQLKTALAPWLYRVTYRASFLYDQTWGGSISADGWLDPNRDYGNGIYNDHHFHNGYYIYAGAVILRYDPKWEWGPRVIDLIRDIANPSVQDPYFTITRHKDWYCGHSWAQGLDYTLDGKNQESTSEAVNAYYAISLYGVSTQNSLITQIGRVLLATEIRSARKYWHTLPQGNIYPPPFSQNGIVGILWSDKADYSTFFGREVAYIHCIQMIPFTPITEDLLPYEWVEEEYPILAPRLGQVTSEWGAYIIEDWAVINKDAAWNQAQLLPDSAFLKGNSRTNTYWWIATRPSQQQRVRDGRGSKEMEKNDRWGVENTKNDRWRGMENTKNDSQEDGWVWR